MGDLAISVRGLGKRYTLTGGGGPRAGYQTLRDSLVAAVRRPFRRSAPGEEFWALKDVSFEVNRGEVVGVIGRNGAGKSTLLKILSRITEPTEGEVDIHGRVGSLLEVGTGFHPELSGRENIYLNGSILGMKRAEITKQFDAMVTFAEVEKFIDTPVKFYSSGMYTRLAFAVAAHLEPEILIVDEVLAVGDAEFQKKCLGKMGEVARGGRTVLFVSHNMGSVANLCDRAIWLERGEIREVGTARSVLARYMTDGSAQSEATVEFGKRPRLPGMGEQVRLIRLEWQTKPPLVFEQDVIARLTLHADSAVDSVAVSVGFTLPDGSRFLTYESDLVIPRTPTIPRTAIYYLLKIAQFPVSPGLYGLDIGLRSGDRAVIDFVARVADIEVVGGENTPSNIMQATNIGVRSRAAWERTEESFDMLTRTASRGSSAT